MTTPAWVLVVIAAVAAAGAVRFARTSRIALAIAVTGAVVAVLGPVYFALGYKGCSHRADCGVLADVLRTAIALGIVVLPVLLVAAALAWLWRRIDGDDRLTGI